jgi:hypothetical protein
MLFGVGCCNQLLRFRRFVMPLRAQRLLRLWTLEVELAREAVAQDVAAPDGGRMIDGDHSAASAVAGP